MVVRLSLTPGLIQGLTEVNMKANRFNGLKQLLNTYAGGGIKGVIK
jgi:hypothetical protein